MISINEAINFAKNTNDDEFTNYILSGMSVPDAIRTVQAMKLDNEVQPQDRAWVNNWLADSVGAFGIGMGNMANDTVVGGLGWILGNIGAGVEKISPFSGTDTEALDTLMRAGVSDEVINSLPLYRDSWFTTGAKGTLWVHNRLEDQLNALRTSWLGKNPSWLAEVSEGSGSSFGFMAVKKLLESNPLTAILAHSGLEALSEAGGFMGDAYRNGMYDRAIGTANKSFATNFLLNAALDYGTGRFSKTIQGIQNPYKKWAAETASEIVNEILQEPSQHVIEEAALNSMRNDTGYLGELGQSVQKWPEIFAQLAPSVASSTALTQALLGLGGMGYNHRYNRDMRTKVPEAIGNIERQQANLNKQADTIDTQRSELLNNQYNYGNAKGNYSSTEGIGVNPANEDMDTNPDYQNDVQKEEADRQARAEKMRSQAEDLRSQSQSITEQLQKLREYAESSPAWVTRDAPQELYDALGKGEDGISMFADDEGLRDDEPNVGTQQETSTSDTIPDDLEGSHTKEERLVDDEPDFDLEEEKDYDTATQEQQQDTQETPSTTPQQEQQNNEPHSMFDDLKGEHDNTQSLIDDEQSETFHQAAHNENAGTFLFNTKGKSYKFGVTATNANNVGDTGISADRRMRYQGRRLEITNSKGKVIATYFPYLSRLDLDPEVERKHSTKWKQSFQNQFMSEINDHLGREGFLDANGNLAPDGNEAFRERWDTRSKSDANSFYDDIVYPEDTYDNTGQAQQQTTDSTTPQQPKPKSSRRDRIIESIRRAVNGDIYHQGNAQGSGTTNADANTFSVRDGEGRYTFKVRAGQFDDKHQRQKKFFGRFIELVDNAGNVIARYSPQFNHMEFSKHAPKDDFTRRAIASSVDYNARVILANNGFYDAKGRLIDDGDKDFRQKEFERWGKIDEARRTGAYMRAEKAWRKRRAKMSFGERMKEDIIDDTIDSIKTKWRRGKTGLARAAAGGRSVVYRAIQYAYDLLESDEGKELRKNIKDKLNSASEQFINAGDYDKKEAKKLRRAAREQNDAVSRVMAAQIMYLASYTGTNPMKLLKNRNFDIISDANPTANLDRNRKTGEPKRDEFGNYKPIRGDFEFIPKGKLDRYGNAVDFARNIIYLYGNSDVSTMIHEPGHFFLQVMRDLFRDGQLTGRALQDWNTLSKWLGLDGIDFNNMTDEDVAKWQDAQEKFATGAEKYVMAGQAPNMKLKRAFDVLRRYMSNVYASAIERDEYGDPVFDAFGDPKLRNLDDVIYYGGADDREHRHETTNEARAVMARIYGGTDKGTNRAAKTISNTESASSDGEMYHQSIIIASKNSTTLNLPFDPKELRTENGNTIDIALSSELIITPEGSTALGYIDADIANLAGIQEGEIQANVGVIRHAEQRHGQQIRDAGYDNVQTFMLDVLNNWSDIREGTDNSLWLILPKEDNHGAIAAIRLHQNKNGIYRVNTLLFARNKSFKNKRLLFAGRPSPASKSGSGTNLARVASNTSGTPTAKGDLSKVQSGESVQSSSSHVNASNTETYHQSAPKRIRRSNNSFINPERYNQLVYHGTWHTILGNKFDLHRVGAGSGARLFGWGIYFSDSKDDVQKYRKAGRNTSDTRPQKDEYIDYITGDTHLDAMSMLRRTSYTPHVEKHGNIYVADIPENETLLNWNAKISEQTDTVKNGLRKAVVRAKQLGANDAVLRRLLAAKTGEEFYKTLENYVVPAIMHNIKGASKGFSNDMATSLLLNQAGIPGLYHANAYLDNATLKPKHNRNFVIWNTDMIKLMSISQDSDFDAKNSFIQAKKGDLKPKNAFTPRQAASLSDEAEQLLNMVEKELANTYHQAADYVREFQDTLANADPDKIDFGNLAHSGFISDIERYNQDSLHGTGHTIEENRMKLSKVGTGERGQYRGWGIYSAQARGVAETYRHFGLPQYPSGRKTFSITLKDGSVLNADDYLGANTKNKDIREIFRRIDFILAATDTIPDSQSILDNLHSYFSDLYTALPTEIAKLEANLKRLKQYNSIPALEWAKKTIDEAKENLKHVDETLKIIDNISDFQISPKPKGNIYHLDVPENDIILNWDAALRNQPKHVRQAIEKIKDFIHEQGEIYRIDTSNIDKAKSGGALYMEIVDVMERYLARYTPDDGVTQAKKRTSLLFNRFGVPGLRFLDHFSRTPEAGKKKTYNFVTWNEDYIKVLGIEPDSDQEAIEYFERYRAEHPDGFINPEAIERFDQLVTHATGNIILGNKFDLRYVGTSEGGDMFGYGAYFEQSPEVAKSYRRYGLKNMGFDKIDVKLSNSTVLSLTDIYTQLDDLRYNPDTKIKLPAKVINSALTDAIKELIHAKIETSKSGNTSWNFSKALQKLVHDIERDAHQALNDGRVNFSKRLLETAMALRAIKSMEFFGEKRGNIYIFDIPEDYELLDWDAKLSEQPEQITPIIREIVDEINNNPAKFLAMGLARRFKNQEAMQAKLSALISALDNKAKALFDKSRRYKTDEIISLVESLPEYQQLVRTVHAKARNVALQLFDGKSINMRNTGGELYNKLTDLMYFGDVRDGTYQAESKAAKIAASMYLNSKGISRHRFLDRGSRSNGKGTHNFVIWNMGKVQMVGIDPSSDQEAIDYYNRTKKLKDLLVQADAEAHFITPEQGERFDQLVAHATGNIITNNKFDLRYVGTNVGSSFFGYGAYFVQSRELAERYRHFGQSGEQGNIYIFDIPEDFELMDWHTPLSQQPVDVKMKLRRLMNELRRRRYSPQQVFGIPARITNLSGIEKSSLDPKDITGGALYQNIVNIFLGEEGQKGRFNIDDRAAKIKTSKLFNEFGIPGLRYSDKYELGRKNSSTHNYVVWDMDRVRMEGIDQSSTQEAIDYFNRYKEEHPDGFITPEALERYDQLAYHGTGHIILGNKFDIRYIGRGQGNQAYGYGAYLTDSIDEAGKYRDYGLKRGYVDKKTRYGDTVITLKDGQTFSYMHSMKLAEDNRPLYRVLYRLADYFEHNPNATSEEALSEVRKGTEKLIQKHSRKRGDKIFVEQLRDDLDAFSSISSIAEVKHTPNNEHKHGNIYEFDIPENEDLLDWDAPLSEQSPKVKKNIRKLYSALKKLGYDKKQLRDYLPGGRKLETGEDLYTAVEGVMGEYLENNPNPEDRITRADARASMMFNESGIPGLRYLDVFDRHTSTSTYSPHSFVIWNMDKMQMLGLTPDSDDDARKYFESGSETYHQSIKYSFTMKDGSVVSSGNSPFDIIRGNEALSSVDSQIKALLRSAAFDKKNLNAQYFLDTLRSNYSKLIKILSKQIEDDEKAIEQLLENEEDKAAAKDMFKNTHSRKKQLINKSQAALQALDDIADIQFTVVVPPQPKALSLLDILNDTPKGTFEEGLASQLSKRARTQMKAVYKMYHGTDLWMKAPNGKKSNLTERQWLAVRTTLFKAWFGDWENDPEHASKVLDENGEPLVVYHGSPRAGFDVFDTSGEGNSYDTGAWFTSNYENAGSYSPNSYKDSIYAVFLNIRNPYIIDGNQRNWSELGDITIYDRETGESIYEKDNGETFASKGEAEDYIANVIGYDPDKDPNQYTVDDEGHEYYNPDFEERYVVEIDEEYSHTNDIVRAVFNGEIYSDNADGVIFKNIYDTGPHDYKGRLSDVFVVPTDTNIKSATGNNGKYSNQDGSIYHQLIGVDGARRLDEQEGVTTRMDLLGWAEHLESIGVPEGKIWYATSWARGKDGNWRYELPYGRVIDRYKFSDKERKERFKLRTKSIIDTLTPKEEKRLKYLDFVFEGVSLADVLDAPELFNAYPELRAITYQEQELPNGYEGFYDARRKIITMNTNLSGKEFRHYLIHEVQHVIQHLEGFAGGSGFNWDDDKKHIQLRDRAAKILDRLHDTQLKAEWLAAIDDFDNAKIKALLNGVTGINQRQIYLDLHKVYYAICKRYDKVYEQYARKSGEVEARNASTRSTMTEGQRNITAPANTEDIPRDKQTIGRRMRRLSMSAESYHQSIKPSKSQSLGVNDLEQALKIAQIQLNTVRRQYFGTPQWLNASAAFCESWLMPELVIELLSTPLLPKLLSIVPILLCKSRLTLVLIRSTTPEGILPVRAILASSLTRFLFCVIRPLSPPNCPSRLP